MSVSSVSFNTDANVRHDRLTAEYQKLRAQAKVLRDGVLTERAKNDKLTEDAKSKEMVIRKLRGENESLTFRNEQLARRVEALQEEADLHNSKKEHSTKKPKDVASRDVIAQLTTMNNRVLVLQEELADKLKQNETLISMMTEMERQHDEEMSDLSKKLREEMTSLEDKLREHERNNLLMSRRTSRPVESVRPLVENISNHSHSEELCPEESVLPPITVSPPPSIDEQYTQTVETIRATLQGLANMFHLMSQRTEIYPFDATMEQLPPHVKKLAVEFAECCRLLNASVAVIDTAVQKGEMEWASDGEQLRSAFQLFTNHSMTMLPELVFKMVPEECRVTWSDSRLEKLNKRWAELLLELVTYFAEFTAICKENGSDKSATLPVFEAGILKIAGVLRELDSCGRARWLVESRFPTVSRRLHCVCDALVDCCGKLATDTLKLAARVRDMHTLAIHQLSKGLHLAHSTPGNVVEVADDEVMDEGCTVPQCSSSIVPAVEVIPTHLVNGIAHDVSKSDAQINVCTCQNGKMPTVYESDKLSELTHHHKEEVSRLRGRIAELESERERHLVDLSLLRRKVSNLGGSDKSAPITDCSDTEHERQFAHSRLRFAMDEREKADANARHYSRECSLLLRNIRSCREDQLLLQEQIATMEKENEKLADELSSVRRGYEFQLSSLTEHVADLNAKLLATDEQKEKKTSPVTRVAGLKGLFK